MKPEEGEEEECGEGEEGRESGKGSTEKVHFGGDATKNFFFPFLVISIVKMHAATFSGVLQRRTDHFVTSPTMFLP